MHGIVFRNVYDTLRFFVPLWLVARFFHTAQLMLVSCSLLRFKRRAVVSAFLQLLIISDLPFITLFDLLMCAQSYSFGARAPREKSRRSHLRTAAESIYFHIYSHVGNEVTIHYVAHDYTPKVLTKVAFPFREA